MFRRDKGRDERAGVREGIYRMGVVGVGKTVDLGMAVGEVVVGVGWGLRTIISLVIAFDFFFFVIGSEVRFTVVGVVVMVSAGMCSMMIVLDERTMLKR